MFTFRMVNPLTMEKEKWELHEIEWPRKLRALLVHTMSWNIDSSSRMRCCLVVKAWWSRKDKRYYVSESYIEVDTRKRKIDDSSKPDRLPGDCPPDLLTHLNVHRSPVKR